jgi:hypothetical protein
MQPAALHRGGSGRRGRGREEEGEEAEQEGAEGGGGEVGLCTLNQVDPCPITYSLSNP